MFQRNLYFGDFSQDFVFFVLNEIVIYRLDYNFWLHGPTDLKFLSKVQTKLIYQISNCWVLAMTIDELIDLNMNLQSSLLNSHSANQLSWKWLEIRIPINVSSVISISREHLTITLSQNDQNLSPSSHLFDFNPPLLLSNV